MRTAAGRRERAHELDAAVATWTASQPGTQAQERLVAAGIPAHISSDSRDFCTDPQIHHRGYLVELAHERLGRVTVEGPRH
ncbi:CoA transferase, partial [Bacillus thuringiensis]|nr:CoA transferase [Bacillus thuringiensis]